jgi:4-amino-4-deoxy-L-arabinose transferase-like glycosyltransferase
MRRSLPKLMLILLLAFGLRLIALSSRTLWYDESFAVLFSEKGLNAMLYGTLSPVDGAAADVHPLLYYTALNGWMRLVGQSALAVRLFGVLTGLLTIAVLFQLARELFDTRVALVAALIAAVAPFHVQYSQEARMYSLLGLLLIGATWCFVRGWRTGSARYWVVFGVLAGLSMYTQQLAAFYLLALGLLPFLARRRDRVGPVLLSALLALLIYLPWLVNLPSQLRKVGTYWIPRPTPGELLLTLWKYSYADLEVHAPLVALLSLTTIAILLVLLIYRAQAALRYQNRTRASLALALWLAGGPIVLMWLLSQWRPVFLARALLPSGLMFYVTLAWLFTRARLPRPILALPVVFWLCTVAAGLSSLYTWETFPRPPFDAADQAIAGHWQPGDRVVHASKITLLPMVYYNRGLAQSYVRDAPGSPEDTLARPTQEALQLLADECIAAAAKGSARVWFAILQEQIAQQGGQSPELNWMNAHYRAASTEVFNDLLIYRFEQPDGVARRAECEAVP